MLTAVENGLDRRTFVVTLRKRVAFSMAIFAVAWFGLGIPSGKANDAGIEFFENHIRPLFIEHCLECHGDEVSGGLRLDSRRSLLVGGDSGPAIALGESAKLSDSLLLQVVRHEGGLEMPPDKKLAPRDIELLTEWIRLGAPWPEATQVPLEGLPGTDLDHWAFQPVQRVQVPATEDSTWGKTPIDAFILARLESAGLTPSPEADRWTLIRRASFALTGLPPQPAEVERFLNDSDPRAYERLIEQLLASPHYGEHWARHWLDVARYSDTKGYVYAREERFWPHAWSYRDWVVQALNNDLPYDQFLLLQIAADQVDLQSKEDLAAMGFLTIGRRFLGVKHDIIDDRIDVVTRGTMALTVGCARCHNHKYDPIPTADYYALYGVFDSCVEQLAMASDVQADEAFQTELAARQEKLREKMEESRATSSERVRQRIADYLQAQTELEKYPAEGFDQIFQPTDLLPGFVRRWEAYLRNAYLHQDPIFLPWHEYQQLDETTFAQQAAELTRRWQETGSEPINPLVKEAFATPPATFAEVIQRYAELLTEIDRRWQKYQTEAAEQDRPAPNQLDDPAAEQLRGVLYGPGAPCEVPNESIVHTETLFDSGTVTGLWKLQGDVERWIIQAEIPVPFALTLVDRETPVQPRIFRRGNSLQKGPEVPRQFLEALAGKEREPFQQGSGRLELAREIIDPANPLTARVMVNRVWTHLIGQGLVTTPSDFGLRAEPPSHPDLLDFLATTFIEEGWSLKELKRQIMLSATFRQASSGGDGSEAWVRARELDPDNRLLWRMNQHRLSFEEFRDSMLAASGSLQQGLGGRPAELFVSPFPTRRTLYGLVDRQFLPSTLRVFDFANPDLHIPQRNETTVPQQALFFLNHPFVIEQARRLAARVSDSPSPEAALRQMFETVYQRPPSTAEMTEGLELLAAATHANESPILETVADWKYGYGPLDEGAERVTQFTELPHFTGEAWQGGPTHPDSKLGWVQLTATGGHPGNDRQHAAIRRWTAPRDMTIRVASLLNHEPAPGDGIRAFIVSSRAGVLHSAQVHQQTIELNLDPIEVAEGETIDFVVDLGDVLNSDQYLWSVKVETTENGSEPPSRWDSVADFTQQRVPQLSPWEQLAQVLLCTNEFLFID